MDETVMFTDAEASPQVAELLAGDDGLPTRPETERLLQELAALPWDEFAKLRCAAARRLKLRLVILDEEYARRRYGSRRRLGVWR